MKHFITPVIQTIFSNTDKLLFVHTQGTGDSVPSNPNFDCASAECHFGKQDSADLVLTWNDDAGSDINGYTIVVNIGGTNIALTNNTNGCGIAESPAGTYTLTCSGFDPGESGCDCPMDINIVSITDGGDNILNVNTENCNFVPSDC